MDDMAIVARAIFCKQMTENQVRTLHNLEINRGFRYGGFMILRLFPGIKNTGVLDEDEYNDVLNKVVYYKPKISDNEGEWMADLEFLHAWTWNIRNSFEGIFEVGKLAPKKKDLLNKIKPLTGAEKEYAESKEQRVEDYHDRT